MSQSDANIQNERSIKLQKNKSTNLKKESESL